MYRQQRSLLARISQRLKGTISDNLGDFEATSFSDVLSRPLATGALPDHYVSPRAAVTWLGQARRQKRVKPLCNQRASRLRDNPCCEGLSPEASFNQFALQF